MSAVDLISDMSVILPDVLQLGYILLFVDYNKFI